MALALLLVAVLSSRAGASSWRRVRPGLSLSGRSNRQSPIDSCFESTGNGYRLDWEASGHAFFDDWDYLDWDFNHGAAQYLRREQAMAEGVTAAHDTHAILRVGERGLPYKRKTAKVRTRKAWKYFLAAVRFEHVPFGCGLWPAFWMSGIYGPWPNNGELDILEYVNDMTSQTSLHTGVRNKCKLDGAKLTMPNCTAFYDLNRMNYDCTTNYPTNLGCAANRWPVPSPAEWNVNPVTFAIERTERFVKIFRIPNHELPKNLLENNPQPDTWDKWIVGYYPLAASWECPNPADVMSPQQLILNINMCGDWAGKIWDLSPTCMQLAGPQQGCRVIDPMFESDLTNDCCTNFAVDPSGTYGTDEYYRTRGFFNISWVKVFQQATASQVNITRHDAADDAAGLPMGADGAAFLQTPSAREEL